VPLRVSTITPTALNTYFFRARAGRNKTRPSDSAASADGGSAAAAEGEGADSPGQPHGAVLHARDVVQAVFWCLSAPENVDVSDIRLKSVPA
jgi:hypothetical protein